MNEGGIWRFDFKPSTLLKTDGASVCGDPVPADQLLSLCVVSAAGQALHAAGPRPRPFSSQPAAAQSVPALRWNLGGLRPQTRR